MSQAECNPEHLARQAIGRAEQIVGGIPGGFARLLHQRVLMLQESPVDAAVGLIFASAGAEIELIATTAPEWRSAHEGRLFPELVRQLANYEPRLDLSILRSLGPRNFHRAARFQIIASRPPKWDRDLRHAPYEIVIVDGIDALAANPRYVLRKLHKLTRPESIVEILSRPGDPLGSDLVGSLEREAVALGFGVRHSADRLANRDNGADSVEPAVQLGLVRLSSPMRDYPVLGREGPLIMGHCQSRLDIAAQIVAGREVLDAGGGTGIGGRRYLSAGATRVVSLDVSDRAIELGRKSSRNDKLDFLQWDLNVVPLPFADESFDVVVCLEVLEHIVKQAEAVSEFRRVLRPGGYLLLSVPDLEFERVWSTINQHENPFHLHVPDRDEFVRLVEGFTDHRWFRQTDVFATVVIEEGAGKRNRTGRFVGESGWDPFAGPAQVVAVLCTKPLTRALSGAGDDSIGPGGKRRPVSTVSDLGRGPGPGRPISSDLHLWSNANASVIHASQARVDLLALYRAQSYKWWAGNNAQVDRISELQRRIKEAEAGGTESRQRLEQAQQQLTNQRQALSHELDVTRRDHSRIEQELEEARDTCVQLRESAAGERRSGEAERSSHEEAMRSALEQMRDLSCKLTETTKQLTESRSRAARSESEIVNSRAVSDNLRTQLVQSESLLNDAAKRERWQGKKIAQLEKQLNSAIRKAEAEIDRLRSTLESDRRAWERERAELFDEGRDVLGRSIERIERRCLAVESRVYDLEDSQGQVANAVPSGNGSAGHRPDEGNSQSHGATAQ